MTYFLSEKEDCGVNPPKLQQILQVIRTNVRRMQLMHPQLSAGFHSKLISQHDRFRILVDNGHLKIDPYHMFELMMAYGNIEYNPE